MTTSYLILGLIGGQEIIIILIIVLVLFGGTKIPQLMRGLGKGMNEYKKAKAGLYDDENEENPEKDNLSESKKKK